MIYRILLIVSFLSISSNVLFGQDTLTIAFGSCNKEDKPQPLWKEILEHKPTYWIWGGDNIYADTENMQVMAQKYAAQNAQPDYQSFKNQLKIYGTWDDHDYGVNDGGKEFSKKKESQKLFFDFLGIPSNSSLRKQEGVYQAYEISFVNKKIKIILLDTRYHRDPIVRKNGVYEPNMTGTILGEKQWHWLEKELKNSKAEAHLIVSSIQAIPEEHRFEKWANFPNERKRLLDLIARTKAKGVVILSGDRHIAEISKINIPGVAYEVYDITSSGLTHAWTGQGTEPNQYRIGNVIKQLNFGILQFYETQQNLGLKVKICGERNQLLAEQIIEFP